MDYQTTENLILRAAANIMEGRGLYVSAHKLREAAFDAHQPPAVTLRRSEGVRIEGDGPCVVVTVNPEADEQRRQADTLRSRLYDSPDCLPGWDTVLGYLSKHHPEHLALMDHTPDATQRDGFWLMHRMREAGQPRRSVTACAFLRAHGIERVNAYPVGLLRARFG